MIAQYCSQHEGEFVLGLLVHAIRNNNDGMKYIGFQIESPWPLVSIAMLYYYAFHISYYKQIIHEYKPLFLRFYSCTFLISGKNSSIQ